MIKFSHLIYYVPNVLESVNFYTQVFDLKTRFVHESNAYAELDTEGVILAFASEELGKMNLPGGFIRNSLKDLPQGSEIAFTTDDPEALYAKALSLGATAVSPPKIKPWGQKVGYVRDPFGVLIEIGGMLS